MKYQHSLEYDLIQRTGPKPRLPKKQWREYKAAQRQKDNEDRIEHIAVLDFETDPFDNKQPLKPIYPFAASLYSSHFNHTFWKEKGETHASFLRRVFEFIAGLPDRYIIYAHNGGKFDFMFLIPFIRGAIQFKGRSIMLARIGQHELRDSFHIIPEALRNWKKDSFDYSKLLPSKRHKFKDDIVRYMGNDARYLHEIVTAFITDFGWKISIGQAAISQLRKAGYRVGKISEFRDEQLRPYLFGGRVECLAGKGHFISGPDKPPFKLFDINSAYPYSLANCRHPIGDEYIPRRGEPTSYTAFLNISCRNYGAFASRAENGDTVFDVENGNFQVSIHEYNAATRLGLIEDVDIHWCIDCNKFSTFEKYVNPIYQKRMVCKQWLADNDHLKGTAEHDRVKKDDMFYKFLLNNTWGKFTQNPRRFRDNTILAYDEFPIDDNGRRDWSFGDYPKIEAEDLGYSIWQRESRPWKFLNVGTGASVTGATRALLMEAINAAVDPIYCDTDSVICRELPGFEIDKTKLGAWDIEATFSDVIIAGKKLYACRDIRYSDFGDRRSLKIKSKGVSFVDPVLIEQEMTRRAEQEQAWSEMQKILEDDYKKTVMSFGPTLTRAGTQHYMRRDVRSTAARLAVPDFHSRWNAVRNMR